MEPSPHSSWVESIRACDIWDKFESETNKCGYKNLCLERDRNWCVLSGSYNFFQWSKLSTGDPIRDSKEGIRTQAAHIVPISCGSFEKTGVRALSQIQFLTTRIVNQLQSKRYVRHPLAAVSIDPLPSKFLLPNKSTYNALTPLLILFTPSSAISPLLSKAAWLARPNVQQAQEYLAKEATLFLPNSITIIFPKDHSDSGSSPITTGGTRRLRAYYLRRQWLKQ